MKYLSGSRCLLFTVAVLLSWPAWGDTNRYTGDTWALVDAKKVMAAAADITLAKYPDSDDATVDKKLVRVYRADGTGECQDETFTKVLTEKGKRNNRTIALSFMLPYSTEEVVSVEILKPDGEVIPVDVAANSKESIDDSQMSMNISDPDSRILQLNIPKVEINDVIHSVTRQTITRPYIPGEYAEENVFEADGYIRHISYEVHAPADRPLKKIALRDEIKGTVVYSTQPGENNTVVHHWEVNNVPRMFGEASMPSPEEVLQRVMVSTTPDWQAVSKWYWDLSKQHLEATTPEMQKAVEDLTAGAKTDVEKAKAIFYSVSKNIRYMGLTPEKDRPGFEPHDVKITFVKKYGVCRDKAALLVSMLRAAGLKAYPVLINVGTKRDAEVADPFFNHAIVGVELKEGEYTLMDPTDEHTREFLPSSDWDQSYLVCRPEGENIKVSHVPPPDEHMMRVKTTGTLSAAGTLEAKTELVFEGANDDAYRNAFSHMKPDDKRRFFEGTLKQAMPGARLKSIKVTPTDMMDLTSVVRAELEYSVEGMTASSSDMSVVSVPWVGKKLGIVNFILGGAGLDKRKYPMKTQLACGVREDISLKLADGFSSAVSLPHCVPVENERMSCREDFEFKNGTLACSRELKLKTVEFSPADYSNLKQTLKAMEYDERKSPVLTVSARAVAKAEKAAEKAAVAAVESNAKVLESHKELNIIDAHTSVYKVRYSKRILNYAGKIREAEVKIDFNPSCQEAKLTKGVVISKTGERQEISADEMNVMDAGWNASAKRYTGGKILVANLPGVDIGSTIEVEYEITTKNRPFLSGFESFQLADELEKKSFEMTVPTDVKMQKLVTGEKGMIAEEDKTGNTNRTYQWTSENIKALPAESSVPPEWLYNATVGYFVGDMKGYLKELNDTMLTCSQKSAKAAEKGQQLAGGKTPLNGVKAIRDFVAQSIRLAGPSFADLPLCELSGADTTLADGYGHAADRAILLHAMLTAAGFKPEFVLASGLPPITAISDVASAFPMPAYFQSVLVRVSLGGDQYYLNDTDQYAQMGATGFDGRMGLVLASRKSEVIKAAKNCSDKTETVYNLTMSENGNARIKVTQRFYGANYGAKNHYFSELQPEERKRYFQELVSHMAQGARPVGELTTQFGNYPGVEQFTVDIDNYSVVDGKYLYFDLPFTPGLFSGGSDQRTLPYFVARRSEHTVRTEIDLPTGFQHVVMAPKSEKLKAPDGGGTVQITSAATAGKYVISHDFETSPAIIPAQDFPEMLKLEAMLGRKSSTVFLLEKDSSFVGRVISP